MLNLEERRRKNKGYWIWYLFEKESVNYLNSFREKEFLKGPNFTPHLTICGPTSHENIIKNKDSLNSIFNLNSSTYLNIEKLKCSNDFYKALYFEITNTTKISRLNKLVSEKLDVNDYIFSPHISLYYGTINEEINNYVKTFIHLKLEKIHLKNLAVFYVDEKNEKWNFVENLN